MEEPEKKSKSQRKREMHGLQELGKELTRLSPDRLRKIEMPEELREAVLFAQTIRGREALRRQIQRIGVLMRDADPEPIRTALEDIAQGSRREARTFQKLERWRDALLAGDEVLMDEILEANPQGDRQRLRQLASNARKELEAAKPPKASRALFRYLRELVEGSGRTAPEQDEWDDGRNG